MSCNESLITVVTVGGFAACCHNVWCLPFKISTSKTGQFGSVSAASLLELGWTMSSI
jgi:hypothetical protein